MNTQNYTRLASVRPVVLSSSAYRHYGQAVFPEGRRTSVTLVYSPDSFAPLFKLGNKTPLFTAESLTDGNVKLTSTNVDFPSWLTIAGTDLIRLCKKAEMDIDEPFMSLDEHLAFHYEPTDELPISTFVTPTLADCDDLADFASASLGTYFTPMVAPPEITDEADELAAFFSALPVTPEAKPAKELADADELAEALSPTQPKQVISRKLPNGKWQRQRRGSRTPKRRNKPASKRITRKGPSKPRAPMKQTYTQAHQQADIALLWG